MILVFNLKLQTPENTVLKKKSMEAKYVKEKLLTAGLKQKSKQII